MALEYGGLDVETAREIAGQLVRNAAGENLRTFLLADVDVGKDLLVLIIRGLRADLGRHFVRIGLANFLDALDGALHEALVDGLLHQSARGAGAYLALVQREHGEALERLVDEIVVLAHHVVEENVGRLAA